MDHYTSCLRQLAAALVSFVAFASGNLSAETFRFDWPAPVSVVVRADMVKKGNASSARYVVDLSARSEGEYALAFRDFEFLTLNGEDARDPKILAQLGPLAALTANLPTMRLSSRGDYLGTLGLEEMLTRMLAALPDGLDAGQRQRLDDYFRSPQVQGMMQQRSGEVWNTWVGAWNGIELNPGQNLSGTVPITIMNRDLTQNVLVEHLGPAAPSDDCPRCVRLRMTTTVEGPEVLQLVSGMLRQLGGRSDDGGRAATQFVSARSMSVTEILTEANTLKPRYAVSNTEVMLRDVEDQSQSQHERKEYWFEWP